MNAQFPKFLKEKKMRLTEVCFRIVRLLLNSILFLVSVNFISMENRYFLFEEILLFYILYKVITVFYEIK